MWIKERQTLIIRLGVEKVDINSKVRDTKAYISTLRLEIEKGKTITLRLRKGWVTTLRLVIKHIVNSEVVIKNMGINSKVGMKSRCQLRGGGKENMDNNYEYGGKEAKHQL